MKTKLYFALLMATFMMACSQNTDETAANESTNWSEVDTTKFLTELNALEKKIEENTGIPKENDLTEAVTMFQDFASIFPEDPEAPDYLLRASDLALTLGQPEKSVKILNQIIQKYPAYKKMEDVKYNRASHMDFELRDTTNAKIAYQEFIDAYPNSPLVNDCRSRIENIRYSIEELTEKFMKDLEENGGQTNLP